MNTIEEIEQALLRLSMEELAKVNAIIDRLRQQAETTQPVYFETCFITRPKTDIPQSQIAPVVVRDHTAFLNSYAPEDEGLYQDAATG